MSRNTSPWPSATLAAAGRAFLPRARALVRAERAAIEAMRALHGERETTLQVGINIGLGSRLTRCWPS
ncbi:hypothetical protein OHA17_10075 [Streptomyces sp. NBC_00212]